MYSVDKAQIYYGFNGQNINTHEHDTMHNVQVETPDTLTIQCIVYVYRYMYMFTSHIPYLQAPQSRQSPVAR